MTLTILLFIYSLKDILNFPVKVKLSLYLINQTLRYEGVGRSWVQLQHSWPLHQQLRFTPWKIGPWHVLDRRLGWCQDRLERRKNLALTKTLIPTPGPSSCVDCDLWNCNNRPEIMLMFSPCTDLGFHLSFLMLRDYIVSLASDIENERSRITISRIFMPLLVILSSVSLTEWKHVPAPLLQYTYTVLFCAVLNRDAK
jgi:hypothetical protein